MYDQDPYGEEIEGGDEDKNDGLNALVSENAMKITSSLELVIRDRLQQGHRSGSAQLDNTEPS